MITYRSRFLSRAEVWYDDEPGDSRAVDWILYYQRSQPVPGATAKVIHTYVLDLTQSKEQLLRNLNKDTAYKIRRAGARDHVVCECCDSQNPTVLDEFEQMYNAFAALKGLSPLNRARMSAMARAGVLDMSVARDSEGNALVYHANYRGKDNATSMELPSLYRKCSNSADRNFLGRVSRYLTWNDVMRFQEQGLKCFDFGGWYCGSDPNMLKINEFKRGFGGQVVSKYQCEQIVSLKGRCVLGTAALINWARSRSARSSEPRSVLSSKAFQGQVSVSAE